jgi:hypothetical protein
MPINATFRFHPDSYYTKKGLVGKQFDYTLEIEFHDQVNLNRLKNIFGIAAAIKGNSLYIPGRGAGLVVDDRTRFSSHVHLDFVKTGLCKKFEEVFGLSEFVEISWDHGTPNFGAETMRFSRKKLKSESKSTSEFTTTTSLLPYEQQEAIYRSEDNKALMTKICYAGGVLALLTATLMAMGMYNNQERSI